MKQNSNLNKLVLFVVLCLMNVFPSLAQEEDKKLNIYGFSEFIWTNRFGSPASGSSAAQVEAFNEDESQEELEDGSRLKIRNFNLLFQSEFTEKLKFQGEISFEREDGTFEIELERLYLDYAFNEKFNLRTGLFLTPFGYLNQNQRNLGYLNYSQRIRDMVNEEFGFTPFLMLGFQAFGTLPFGESGAGLKYKLAAGRMRNMFAKQDVVDFTEFGSDTESEVGYAATLELFFNTPSGEINFGLSGYANPKIRSLFFDELGEEFTEDMAQEMRLRELAFTPYVRLDFNKWQFLTELHWIQMKDLIGNTEAELQNQFSVSSQLMFKTSLAGKPFYPYIRYDVSNVPNIPGGGAFYGIIEEEEGEFVREYIPNRAELVGGFAWDLFTFNRFKIEYGHILDGIEPQNSINISSSFTF